MSLLDDASLIVTPNGYKGGSPNGTLYSVKPTSGAGDMVVTRNTTSTRVNSAGLIQSVAFNAPRLDYTGGGCPSILVEPQRTNNVLYSEQFDVNPTPWFKADTTVTANATTAPDGTSTADNVVPFATATFHSVRQAILVTPSISYTFSVYAKANGYTKVSIADAFTGGFAARFDLSAVSVISTIIGTTATITNVGSGWYRLTATFTTTASSTPSITGYPTGATLNGFGASFTGDGTSGVFLWGAQLEAGSYPTSYIPTTTIPLVRNDDVITKTGISSLIGQTEGTIFWNVKDLVGSTIAGSGNPELMIRNGNNLTMSNWIGITTNPSPNPFRITVRTSTPALLIDYSTNITSAKACVKYGTFGAKLFLNGNPTPVATSLVNPNFSFDNILFSGAKISYKTNLFALWTIALSDAQCISLTT
jgi:hypothetical protein